MLTFNLSSPNEQLCTDHSHDQTRPDFLHPHPPWHSPVKATFSIRERSRQSHISEPLISPLGYQKEAMWIICIYHKFLFSYVLNVEGYEVKGFVWFGSSVPVRDMLAWYKMLFPSIKLRNETPIQSTCTNTGNRLASLTSLVQPSFIPHSSWLINATFRPFC